MKEQLEQILGTIISQDILNLITDKQKSLLKMMIENLTRPNKGAFYYKSKEESRKVIYSILDYGKKKYNELHPKHYSDKAAEYLKQKNLI